ncbi:hypothetical protein [Halomonas binhaiensis]|uniref:Uncharacterized protein n=1 Tax=Halomonas binhaiensis TaxID=2562282 RepID=A0A5C1N955_9GAMM|nr:hypothetical protein [Halomonas binhaiensis]QEM80262.1 hypothetical protein E4T21_00835 [Halomonas binhaiensis]
MTTPNHSVSSQSPIGPHNTDNQTLWKKTLDDLSLKNKTAKDPDPASHEKETDSDEKLREGISKSENEGYQHAETDAEGEQALIDYLYIGPPDEVAPGLIRYENQKGEKFVISDSDNPELYAKVSHDYAQLKGINISEEQGYRLGDQEASWPPVAGTTVGPEGEMGPGLIRYQNGDDKVVVSYDSNPDLYTYLSGMHEILTNPDKRGAIEQAERNGATLAGHDDTAPGPTQYKQLEIGADIITYQTESGDKVVVSKDLTPELFGKVEQAKETHDIINDSIRDGYQLSGPNDYLEQGDITVVGSVEELGNGLIRYETSEGKFIVSKEISPQLYDKVSETSNSWFNIDSTRDTGRETFSLPKPSDIDVMNMDTGVHVDENDNGSPTMSVGELATKSLLDDYRQLLEDGKVNKDDPRAKLVIAIEAQAAYQNGHSITGYEEKVDKIFGDLVVGTTRKFDDDPTQLTAADMHDIIDGPKLVEELTSLFSNETIHSDYKEKINSALTKLDNKEQIESQLRDLVENPEYIKYLESLKNQGLDEAAMQDLNNVLSSLAVFDEDAATRAAQKIQRDALIVDLNAIMGDASKVTEENQALATKDLFLLIKGLIKGGIDMPRRLQSTYEKFINETLGNNKTAGDVDKALKELGEKFEWHGKISQADINTALASGTYLSVAERGNIGKILDFLNQKGLLGSLSSGVSLFSGIYQLVGKGGQLGDEPLERLGIARDFLSFAGGSEHFVKLGSAVAETLGKGNLIDFLGLDKSVPEIWGKDKSIDLGKFKNAAGTPISEDIKKAIYEKLSTNYSSMKEAVYSDFPNGDKLESLISESIEAKGGTKVAPGIASKLAASALKVIGPATDIAGGIAGIVLGAFTINNGIQSGHELTKAQGGIDVATGGIGLIAGASGVAGFMGSTLGAALTGPLFLLTAVLGVIGSIISFFVEHDKKQQATDKEGQWFKDLANIGLLQSDWGDKVEYARYSFHHYGGRDAPMDESIFKYQQSEWENFTSTPSENGSSSNRLNEALHNNALSVFGASFYEENRDIIDVIDGNWEAWGQQFGGDMIVSIDDLKKIAKGEEGNWSPQEQEAAQFMLDHPRFMDLLDTMRYGERTRDDMFSDEDIALWLEKAKGQGELS